MAPVPAADTGPATQDDLVSNLATDISHVADAVGDATNVSQICGAPPLSTSWSLCLQAIADSEKTSAPAAGGSDTDGLAAVTSEEQQIINATTGAGYTSEIVTVGGEPIVVVHAPTGMPAAALQPADTSPIILPGQDPAAPHLPVVEPGCGGTVIGCVIEQGDSSGVVIAPDGGVFVPSSSGSGLLVPGGTDGISPATASKALQDLPSGWGLTDSGIAVPDAGNAIAATRPAEAASAFRIPPLFGNILKTGGRILGAAGIAFTGAETVVDMFDHNWVSAGLHGLQTGFGVWLFAGGGEWMSAGFFALVGGGLPGFGLAIIGTVVVALAVNWALEWLFGDLFAPDIYVINSTGHAVSLRVTLPVEGAHDIVPAWNGGTWAVGVQPDGTLRTPGGAVSHLHYELLTPAPWQRASGWVVPRSDFRAWAARALTAYGFSPAAVQGFVQRWGYLGDGSGALAIYPQSGPLLERLEPLHTAAGDESVSVRRVWFVIGPAQSGTTLPAPSLPAVSPEAVDVQEWGVFLDAGADTTRGLAS